MQAGIRELVGIAPGIVGQSSDVAARAPIIGRRRGDGLFDQRFQALFASRKTTVVELVHCQRLSERRHILLGRGDFGVLQPPDYVGGDDGGKNTDDDDGDHQFDQRKAARISAADEWRSKHRQNYRIPDFDGDCPSITHS